MATLQDLQNRREAIQSQSETQLLVPTNLRVPSVWVPDCMRVNIPAYVPESVFIRSLKVDGKVVIDIRAKWNSRALVDGKPMVGCNEPTIAHLVFEGEADDGVAIVSKDSTFGIGVYRQVEGKDKIIYKATKFKEGTQKLEGDNLSPAMVLGLYQYLTTPREQFKFERPLSVDESFTQRLVMLLESQTRHYQRNSLLGNFEAVEIESVPIGTAVVEPVIANLSSFRNNSSNSSANLVRSETLIAGISSKSSVSLA